MSVVLIKHSCSVSAKKDHCAIFVTILNLILERTLRDQSGSDPDNIFVKNDPVLIRSSLFDGAVNLKPGIISVSPNVLRGWIPNGGALKFEDLRASVIKGITPFDSPRSWSQIDQFVELKKHRAKLNTDFLGKRYSRLGLTNITQGILLNMFLILSNFTAGSQSDETESSDNGATSSRDAASNGTLPFSP